MAYGILASGFVIKSYDAIRASLQDRLRHPDRLGAGLDLSESSPLGQVVDCLALEVAEVWELGQAAWAVIDPAQAEGQALDGAIGSLFNFPRLTETPTIVELTLSGTPGTVVPEGSQVSNVTTGEVFTTRADATIGGGGTVDVSAEALVAGAVDAPAGSLTVIETPVVGWSSVTNAEDGVVGDSDETDAEYVARFEQGRATAATCTAAAIRAKILGVADLSAVLVRENLQIETDGLGQPGKSFWVIVDADDPTDLAQRQEIAGIILANKPAGILAYGDTSVEVEDPPAYVADPVVSFSYVTEVEVWVRVLDVELDGREPADWDDQVAAAVLALGADLGVGDDVVYGRVVRAVYGVAGVVGATIYVGTTEMTTGVVNLEIDPPERARLDSSRITVSE